MVYTKQKTNRGKTMRGSAKIIPFPSAGKLTPSMDEESFLSMYPTLLADSRDPSAPVSVLRARTLEEDLMSAVRPCFQEGKKPSYAAQALLAVLSGDDAGFERYMRLERSGMRPVE
jgi:ABC-type uncharacterized transport system involved in gliding motility auxiliary subunit